MSKNLSDRMAAATKTPPKTKASSPVRGRGGHIVAARRSFPKRITLDLSIDQNDYLRDQGIDLGGSKAEVLRALLGELESDIKLRERVSKRIRSDRREQ